MGDLKINKDSSKKNSILKSISKIPMSAQSSGKDISTVARINSMLWIIVAFIAIAIVYMLYIRLSESLGIGDNKIKNIPIVYTTSGKLMYRNQLMGSSAVAEADLSWGVASNLQNSANLSNDGTALLYLNNTDNSSGTLYLKFILGNFLPNDRINPSGTKIASNVLHNSFLFLTDNKSVVYLTVEGTLSFWNGKTTVELDHNVTKLLSVDSMDNVYYLSGDDNSILKSVVPTASNYKNIKVISNNVKQIYDIRDDGTVLYFFNEPDGTQSLAQCNQNGPVILAKGCETLLNISENGNVLFIRKVRSILDTSTVFLDQHKNYDEQLKKPTKADFTQEQQGIFGNLTTVFDEDAYNLAVQKYEAKLARDEIRNGIEKDVRVIDSRALIFRTNQSETVIDESIHSVLGMDTENGHAAYEKLMFDSQNKYDIDNIESIPHSYEILERELSNRNNYKKTVTLWSASEDEQNELETPNLERIYFSNGKSIYTLDDKANLVYKPSADGEDIPITDGVRYFDTKHNRNIGIRLYDNTYELFRVERDKYIPLFKSNPPLVIKGIYENMLMLYANYNNIASTGDLLLLSKDIQIVSENVYSYSARTKDMIYILNNFNSVTGGDLYVYNDGDLIRLDSDVTDILTAKKWGFGV